LCNCASRKSRNLREHEGYPSIIMLTDAHFSQVMSSNSVLDFTFACCPGTREPGSAPPNRSASEVRCKTPEIDLWRPPLVDLFVPPLARLALSAGHHQARNGRGLASSRLSPLLDLEGATRPTRTTCHFARGPRSHPQDVPRESPLGSTPHPWRIAQTRHQHR
jgi:hypothetical protein